MKLTKTMIPIICLVFISTSIQNLYAQRGRGNSEESRGRYRSAENRGQKGQPLGFGDRAYRRLMNKLTADQREEVQGLVDRMTGEGASREEIHAAVAELLAGWGIEIPEKPLGRPGFGRGGVPGMMKDLTAEQRQQVEELIESKREEGASREEIHAAVAELLAGWGIEIPEKPLGRPGFGRGGVPGLMKDLTAEQREEVLDLIEQLREQGVSRKEIREAVRELVEGFGIESPESEPEGSSDDTAVLMKKSAFDAVNYPNPFNPETTIFYNLTEPNHVTLSIYNVQGQLIRRLVDEFQTAGQHSAVWDGRDADGEMAATGIYLFRIDSGDQSITKRMLLTK